MTAVPETKATWTDGVDALDSTNLHAYLRDPLQFLMNKPAAQVRQIVAQTLTTAVSTAITFTAEDLDDDPAGTSGHSTAVNTSRYTAVYPGWYLLAGAVSYAANATGRRGCRWAVNGTVLNSGDTMLAATASGVASVPAETMLAYLGVGDYVELQGHQESGGNLATAILTSQQSRMSTLWERLTA